MIAPSGVSAGASRIAEGEKPTLFHVVKLQSGSELCRWNGMLPAALPIHFQIKSFRLHQKEYGLYY